VRSDVREHLVGVRGDIRHLVDVRHHTFGIDEKGDPLREVLVLLVGPAFDAVLAADRAIDVAQQREIEAVLLAELEILGGRVEAGAEDLGSGFGERWASITEALAFTRSARRRGLGVPPEHDPGPPFPLEVDGVAGLIGKREVRGDVSCCDHQLATSMRPAHVAYRAA
jgi:hypothetical protein